MMRWLTLAAVVLAAWPAAAETVAVGNYECWYFSTPQMGLNFRITGAGTYTDVEGKRGSFTLGANNAMSFRGGAHDGTRAVYKNKNPPTVSLLGPRGDEAAFCELAK